MVENEKRVEKVSIVIPIFNVEKYIPRLINNIKQQKFEDYEVVLVDDGSTDNSLAIVENAISDDPRFKLFHIENSGTGAARNFGTRVATGKYVYYMDPDDLIDADLLVDNVKIMENSEADVVVFGFETVDENGIILDEKKYSDDQEKLNGYTIEKQFEELYEQYFFHALWHKIFKRSFILDNNIYSPTWSNSQDRGFMVRFAGFNPRIAFNLENKCYYKYHRMRVASSTANFKENLMAISLQLANEIINLVQTNNIQLSDKLKYMIFVHDVFFYAGITNFLRPGAPKQIFAVKRYLQPFYEQPLILEFLGKNFLSKNQLTTKEKTIFFMAKYRLATVLWIGIRLKRSFFH